MLKAHLFNAYTYIFDNRRRKLPCDVNFFEAFCRQDLAEDIRARGDLDLSECFIDGMFVVAKKGGSEWERPSGAKA